MIYEDLNGRKVNFPFLAKADKVAAKAIRDARRRKALSIYRFAVRYVSWLQRHCSTGFTVRVWAKSVKKISMMEVTLLLNNYSIFKV